MLEDGNIVARRAGEAEEDGEVVGVRLRWSDAHRKSAGAQQHAHVLQAPRLLRNVKKCIMLATLRVRNGKEFSVKPRPPHDLPNAVRWTSTRRRVHSTAAGPKTVIKNRSGGTPRLSSSGLAALATRVPPLGHHSV